TVARARGSGVEEERRVRRRRGGWLRRRQRGLGLLRRSQRQGRVPSQRLDLGGRLRLRLRMDARGTSAVLQLAEVRVCEGGDRTLGGGRLGLAASWLLLLLRLLLLLLLRLLLLLL